MSKNNPNMYNKNVSNSVRSWSDIANGIGYLNYTSSDTWYKISHKLIKDFVLEEELLKTLKSDEMFNNSV